MIYKFSKNLNLEASTKYNEGMIALMSAIILSVILLMLAVTLSFTGLNNRFNVLDSEVKEYSSTLADACIDVALLGFAQNSSYAGNINTIVGGDTCYVGPVTTIGSQKIFKTRGIHSNFYTNLKVVIDATNFSVISVEEVLVF